jgi:hypothetical protein
MPANAVLAIKVSALSSDHIFGFEIVGITDGTIMRLAFAP